MKKKLRVFFSSSGDLIKVKTYFLRESSCFD